MKNRSMEARFHKRFPNQKYSKLVLFRNPKEFSSMYIEKINPNHHGLIWGRRRKDLKKGTSYIKAGEIWFSILVASLGLSQVAWIDMVTGYVFGLLAQVTLLSGCVCFILAVLLYYMPFKLNEKQIGGHHVRDTHLFGDNRLGIILQ